MTRGYGFSVDTELSLEEAEVRIQELLKQEGFGVLTEIDVQRTLKEKLGVDFRPYKIIGACNPPLAHQALQAEPDIGLLLPCNVVVEARSEHGTRISFLDPETALGLVANPQLKPIAKDAAERLRRVADRLPSAPTA